MYEWREAQVGCQASLDVARIRFRTGSTIRPSGSRKAACQRNRHAQGIQSGRPRFRVIHSPSTAFPTPVVDNRRADHAGGTNSHDHFCPTCTIRFSAASVWAPRRRIACCVAVRSVTSNNGRSPRAGGQPGDGSRERRSSSHSGAARHSSGYTLNGYAIGADDTGHCSACPMSIVTGRPQRERDVTTGMV